MFNNDFSNQKINIEQLDQPIEGQFDELNDEELDKVVGGFYAVYWNPYPNPWTSLIIGQTKAAQALFQVQNDNFLAWLSS